MTDDDIRKYAGDAQAKMLEIGYALKVDAIGHVLKADAIGHLLHVFDQTRPLTNDPAEMEERSRPCTEREAREEDEAARVKGAFG